MIKKEDIPIKKIFNKRIVYFGTILILLISFLELAKAGVILVNDSIINGVDVFVFSMIVFVLINMLLRLTVSRVFSFLETEVEIEQRILLTKIYTIFFYVVGFALIFWKIGVSSSNIVLFLGLATTGIAFAIRDVLMSYFAWFIVLNKKPLKIGDYIKVDNEEGIVDRIGTFFVTIKNSKYQVKIPNRSLLDKQIVNYGKKKNETISLELETIPKGIEKIKKFGEYSFDIYNKKLQFQLILTNKEDKEKAITELYKLIEKKKK
ncbi:hypothetical protein BVX95_00095 [archaeon D22]|nr:hypothetical protein BVX95_00095 [archaeon D22]